MCFVDVLGAPRPRSTHGSLSLCFMGPGRKAGSVRFHWKAPCVDRGRQLGEAWTL